MAEAPKFVWQSYVEHRTVECVRDQMFQSMRVLGEQGYTCTAITSLDAGTWLLVFTKHHWIPEGRYPSSVAEPHPGSLGAPLSGVKKTEDTPGMF